MRPSLLVRVASRVPLRSTMTEFSARSYWARFSSDGRSWATAIMIPKIHETSASSARPMKTRGARSFFSRGLCGLAPPRGRRRRRLLAPAAEPSRIALPPSAVSACALRLGPPAWRLAQILAVRRSSAERPSPLRSRLRVHGALGARGCAPRRLAALAGVAASTRHGSLASVALEARGRSPSAER